MVSIILCSLNEMDKYLLVVGQQMDRQVSFHPLTHSLMFPSSFFISHSMHTHTHTHSTAAQLFTHSFITLHIVVTLLIAMQH